jgi:MFS family permease
VLGINVAAVYLGLTLGPFTGGILIEHAGWRSLFHLNGVLGIVAWALAATRLRGEWAGARGERFDVLGALVYAGGISALIFGLGRLPDTAGWLLLGAGGAGIAAFLAWERRTPAPLLEVGLFRRNAGFTLSNLAALVHYSATFATGFFLSLYLQYVGALPPARAGLVLAAQPVVMTLLSPLAGRLSDRFDPRILASAGMATTTAALGLLSLVGPEPALPRILAGLLLLGVGFALFSSPNTNAILSAVGRESYGVAAGILGTMRVTGQMLSMGFALLLVSVHLGGARISPAMHGALLEVVRTGFAVLAGLCLLGTFASAARGRVPPADAPGTRRPPGS